MDSKQEEANERRDQTWRRWTGFCQKAGLGDDLFLRNLAHSERELTVRSFLSLYRLAEWNQSGSYEGIRSTPVVANTVRDAAGHLGSTFRNNFEPSPLHLPHGSQLLPSVRSLLKAFENIDPPKNIQKAVTPKLLRWVFRFAGGSVKQKSAYAQAADTTIGGFFFGMRSCEHSKTPVPGKTKLLTLGCVVFRGADKRTLSRESPYVSELAQYVTITFVDQKNGVKMDSRTQMRTGDPVLCPVIRWASAVRRIVTTIPDFNDDTPVCSVRLNDKVQLVTNSFVKTLLRTACSIFGGYNEFGFHPNEIGNKSIRSGAAMALFLMDHSPAKIMIMGRWSSDAFLDYIRPQVLEWTNNMSKDMIQVDDFIDLTNQDKAAPSDPRLRTRHRSFNGGDSVVLPKFYLFH